MSEQTPVTEAGRRFVQSDIHDYDDYPLTTAQKAEIACGIEAEARAQPDLAALRDDDVLAYIERTWSVAVRQEVAALLLTHHRASRLSDATEPVADGSGDHDHDWVATVEYDEGRTENVERCFDCGAFRPASESPE